MTDKNIISENMARMMIGLVEAGFSVEYAYQVAGRVPQFLASLKLLGMNLDYNRIINSQSGDVEFNDPIDIKNEKFLAHISLALYDNQNLYLHKEIPDMVKGVIHNYKDNGTYYSVNVENNDIYHIAAFLEAHKENGTEPFTGLR